MARPSTAPKLAALDPREIAQSVCDLVDRHVGRLAFPRGVTDYQAGPALSSTLGCEMLDLVRYAQTGDVGDWGDDSGALDVLQTICEALYSQAGVPGTFGLGPIEDAEDDALEDQVSLVLVAAPGTPRAPSQRRASARGTTPSSRVSSP